MPNRLFIPLLAALSMMGALSIDAYLPALPSISAQFSATPAQGQQTLTIYLAAFAFMTLFYGTLSDSFGRRSVILVSLVLYFFSSLGASFSGSLTSLMLFRFLQGLSAGAGNVVGRAMIGDALSGPAAQRTMAYVSMVFGLAPALAPILGGWLQAELGWRSIFLFISGFTLLLLGLCFFYLPETLIPAKRHPFHLKEILYHYGQIGRHAHYLLRAAGIAMAFFTITIYVGSAPAFILSILHLKVTEFAWLFVPIISGMTLGSWWSGRVAHSYAPATTIKIGYVIMGIALIANVVYYATFVPQVPWAVLPIMIFAFGLTFAMPAMTILTLELFPHRRGLASSGQTFLFLTVFALGSGVISPLIFNHAFAMAVVSLSGLGLSAILWWRGTTKA